jgi:hypothetical protein
MHEWHRRVAEMRAETPVITADFEGYGISEYLHQFDENAKPVVPIE